MVLRWIAIASMLVACGRRSDAPSPPPPTTAGTDGAAPVAPDAGAAPRPNPFDSFATTAPIVGAPAPAIELTTAADTSFSLAAARARGPVVLVFGSFSCPPFRMKQPRLEELARRWRGRAEVYLVFSEEAHAQADGGPRLNAFADQVQAMDGNGDGTVTVAEYQGPRFMFDAFDIDHDGAVRSYEFLAARRLDQFAAVQAPTTMAERRALAQRFRGEVPGDIPIVLDGLDHAVANGYGGLPNMAYLIAVDGTVAWKIPWTAVPDLEAALAKLTGAAPPAAAPPLDLTAIAAVVERARVDGKDALVQFTARGCHACEALTAGPLQDPAVQAALAKHPVQQLALERDDAWRLFEALGLGATPAFVRVGGDGTVRARLQGSVTADELRAFVDG